ncbi:hypothetical protein IFR05_001653 [Cadophora sp. M221]|nr:hypothetical protein IFR05_001653 [Cadophora sp. M221]
MSDLFRDLVAPNGKAFRQPLGLFINNDWVPSSTGEKIQAICPADESVIAEVFSASVEDVDTAVKAARAALENEEWQNMDTSSRGDLLYNLANLMHENLELLATIESWDNGKGMAASTHDIHEAYLCIKYYAGWADKVQGQVINTSGAKLIYTIREPVGVCGQIIPWNYPLAMAAWKIGPAIACGNTVVIKAAEQTPLSLLFLASLIKEAGFPPGVVNCINGYGRMAGSALVQHPGVDKIAFTGSTSTGREIMRMAAGTLKNITLETGGKSPLVIFPDADLNQAIRWGHMGIMVNQGQICTASSRLIVHRSIYESFVTKFAERVLEISKVGMTFDDTAFQGPQVSKPQLDRVLSYVDSGLAEGARLVCGGKKITDFDGKGYFIQPTVFADVTSSMRIFQEEVFGPFVVITPFDDEAEALKLANDSEFGLGASIFTKDIRRAHKFAKKVQAGMVWINSTVDSDYRVPFGGAKQSGVGRELGEAALNAYSSIKAVHVNLGFDLSADLRELTASG